jgi:hypothetical protein
MPRHPKVPDYTGDRIKLDVVEADCDIWSCAYAQVEIVLDF